MTGTTAATAPDFYARLRDELQVCRVTVPLMPGTNQAWLVTRYDDVVIVLKDSRFAKSRLHASNKPWLPSFAKPGAQYARSRRT